MSWLKIAGAFVGFGVLFYGLLLWLYIASGRAEYDKWMDQEAELEKLRAQAATTTHKVSDDVLQEVTGVDR